MSIDVELSGEGIAAIIAISVTAMSSVYTMIRTIRADRKMDRLAAAQEANVVRQDATHKALEAVVSTVAGVQVNVAKVEKATNSLKDALVDTTKTAWLLRGRNEGIAAEKARSGTSDPTQPEGAPTLEELKAATQAQVQAVANDATIRNSEAKTIKP